MGGLCATLAGWPVDSMAVVGSSLGGFYATALAERLGCRAVLFNPAVHPARDLAAHVGEHTLGTIPEERFLFEPAFVQELLALKCPASHGPSAIWPSLPGAMRCWIGARWWVTIPVPRFCCWKAATMRCRTTTTSCRRCCNFWIGPRRHASAAAVDVRFRASSQPARSVWPKGIEPARGQPALEQRQHDTAFASTYHHGRLGVQQCVDHGAHRMLQRALRPPGRPGRARMPAATPW